MVLRGDCKGEIAKGTRKGKERKRMRLSSWKSREGRRGAAVISWQAFWTHSSSSGSSLQLFQRYHRQSLTNFKRSVITIRYSSPLRISENYGDNLVNHFRLWRLSDQDLFMRYYETKRWWFSILVNWVTDICKWIVILKVINKKHCFEKFSMWWTPLNGR